MGWGNRNTFNHLKLRNLGSALAGWASLLRYKQMLCGVCTCLSSDNYKSESSAQIIINIENTAPPDPTRFVVDIYAIYKPRQLKLCQDPVKRMLHCLIETGGFQPDLPCLHGSLK